MLPLDARKIRILRAIVKDYVSTTKPVGSERLIELYQLDCKSATVRNEMAEMAEMGYLAQPHTSSGRIPTDRGYRFYVDSLMDPPGALDAEEMQGASAESRRKQYEIEEIITQTCRVLSGLTSCASLATDPSTDATKLQRAYLTHASPRHVLLVTLLSTGHVEHRLVEVGGAPTDSALISVSNYINSFVAGKDLDKIGRAALPEATPRAVGNGPIVGKIFAAVAQVAKQLSERRIYWEGTNQLLRQPEFQDVQRLENLLATLEQRSALYEMLRCTLLGRDRTIIIGMENSVAAMQNCSVVTTSYSIGDRPAGYLGVIGPTRMNYDRAVASVGLMAHNLSQMLTNLSLA